MIETKNAEVTGFYLGGWDNTIPSDSGILTCFINLEWHGGGVGFGGYVLGKDYTDFFIRKVLQTLQVPNLAKIKGTHCRALLKDWKAYGIQHWSDDKLIFTHDTLMTKIEDGTL